MYKHRQLKLIHLKAEIFHRQLGIHLHSVRLDFFYNRNQLCK